MTSSEFSRDETFRSASVIPKLEFTGERIVPGLTGESLFRQHEERYIFAAQYVYGKHILDVACGTGVGTSFLRDAGARAVFGLDIDPDSVAFARVRYPSCEFAEGDATNMSFPDSSVDILVSFETLEHLEDARKFLMECRRVLKPGGLLICSTPNRTISRWGKPNPYHHREFTASEFGALLSPVFAQVRLYAQEPRIYPIFVVRKVVAHLFDSLGLTSIINRLLRREFVQGAKRVAFQLRPNEPTGGIRPYVQGLLFEPTFIIAVATNSEFRDSR